MREVGGIVHRLVVDLDDHISGTDSGLFSAAAFFHRAHQHAVAALDPKEISQLRCNVFHHQPAAHPGVDDDDRDRQVEVRQVRQLGHLWHLELTVLTPPRRLVPVGELHLDRHSLTVAADAEIHDAAGRRFLNHPAQLGGTLYRGTVQAYDDVVLVQPGFSGGSVLVDHGDRGSVLFLEFQFAQPLRRNVSDVHSEIRRSAALFRAVIPVPAFARTIVVQPRWLRAGDQRKKKHAKQEAMDHSPSRIKVPPLATDAAEVDIPRIRPDLQHRSATIKLTLCSHRFRPPRSAFAGHTNVRKVTADRVAIGDFDLRPNGDRKIVGKIDGDVAGRRFKRGIVVTASPVRRQQFHNDSPSRSFRLHRRRSVQLDTASAGLGLHTSFRGSQSNAARARLNFRRPSDLAQLHAPATGRGFHLPATFVHPNTAAARLQHRALQSGKNDYASPSTFRLDLALGRCNLDVSSARLQTHVALHAADFNRAPAGFRRYLAADIIQVNISTTTLEVDTSGNPSRVYAAAPGLDLGGLQVPWHIDDKIIRALTISPALRLRHDPSRVSLYRRVDPVRLKFAAGLLFRRCRGPEMNNASHPRLRSTLNPYRTRGQFHPQILRRTQVSSHFLDPVAAFAIHPNFLAECQG